MQQLKTELSRENAAVSSGTKPENPGRIKHTRRAIARILTIQNEKKKSQDKVKKVKSPEVGKKK